MCYQGNCVNSANIFYDVTLGNPCNPNPCNNGGLCILNNVTSSLVCRCSAGKAYIGKMKLTILDCKITRKVNLTKIYF